MKTEASSQEYEQAMKEYGKMLDREKAELAAFHTMISLWKNHLPGDVISYGQLIFDAEEWIRLNLEQSSAEGEQ